MPRNFKRLPGQIENFDKLNKELDNQVKQLNLFGAEIVYKKTSKDEFEVNNFTKTLKYDASTATAAQTNDTLATVISKLKESGII